MTDKEWIGLLLEEIDDDIAVNVYRHFNFKSCGGGAEVATIEIIADIDGEKKVVTVPMDLPLTDSNIKHVSRLYTESTMNVV